MIFQDEKTLNFGISWIQNHFINFLNKIFSLATRRTPWTCFSIENNKFMRFWFFRMKKHPFSKFYGNRMPYIRSAFFIAVYTEKNYTNPYTYIRVKWIRVRTNSSVYTGNNWLKKVETRIYGFPKYGIHRLLTVYTDRIILDPYTSAPYIRINNIRSLIPLIRIYGPQLFLAVCTDI